MISGKETVDWTGTYVKQPTNQNEQKTVNGKDTRSKKLNIKRTWILTDSHRNSGIRIGNDIARYKWRKKGSNLSICNKNRVDKRSVWLGRKIYYVSHQNVLYFPAINTLCLLSMISFGWQSAISWIKYGWIAMNKLQLFMSVYPHWKLSVLEIVCVLYLQVWCEHFSDVTD